jgi:hypothetical protein
LTVKGLSNLIFRKKWHVLNELHEIFGNFVRVKGLLSFLSFLRFIKLSLIFNIMKILSYSMFFLLALVLFGACTEDEAPQGLSASQVEGTWGIDPTSIRVQGLGLDALYDAAGIAAEDRPDWSTFRIAFSSTGVYTIQNVDLLGFQPQGTWQIEEGKDTLLINPGNIELVIIEYTATTMRFAYAFSTAGTPFSALGGRVTVSGTLVK